MKEPTIRDNVEIAGLQRIVVPLNCYAAFISQEVVATEDKDDLYHQVEIGTCHTVCEAKASEHRDGIIHIVNVDVTSGRNDWQPTFSLLYLCLSMTSLFTVQVM